MRTAVEVVGGDSWFIDGAKDDVLAILRQGGFVDLVTLPHRQTITINANLVVKVTEID